MRNKLKKIANITLGAMLLVGSVASCKDDIIMPSIATQSVTTRTETAFDKGNSGLVRNDDGTWTATRRVPLVGAGRVIDNMSEAFVSVGNYDVTGGANHASEYEQAAQVLVDTDLKNTFTPSSIISANLILNQIISVRDLNYEYAEGQKVGFALKNSGGVLSVDVLGGLWVDTYLNGQATGDKFAFTISSGLINIGLGSVTGGDATSIYVVEGTATKPFDEVRLGQNGIELDVFQNISILYAYVGDNPIIPAINVGDDKMDQYKLSYDYFNNKVKAPTEPKWTSDPGSVYKLIDDDLTNGPGTFLVDASSVTVDFGRTIPSGSEVGFYTTYWQLLGTDIRGTYVLEAYNDTGEKVASYSSSTILNVSIGEGGEIWTTMRIPDDCTHCSRLKFGITGVNVTVGSSSIHYAYVREPTVVDVSSYFTLADATVYVPNYRFADPDVTNATVTYEVISRPNNATTEMGVIKEDNLLTNMNVEGDYVIKATYTEPNKEPITCTATITRKAKAKTYCNNPLINKNGEDEWEAFAIDEEWGINIFGKGYEGRLPNVVNENTGDYITASTSTVSLISNSGIIGVKAKNGQKINSEGKVVRAGFIFNRVNKFLAADVLKFLQIKLFNGETEVENKIAFDNNGVSLGLIGNSGENSLARLSIDTDQEFDRIELWYGGTLSLNLGEDLQIYYAFWDEASSECANPGEECMELITNANYGAKASVNTTALLTAGDIIFDIGNIVDNDNESAATFVKLADVGTEREIEVTFDEIQGNQEVGFILSDITAIANIELINIVQIFAYNGEQEVGESTSGRGLNVKLLGGGDKSYVSVTPPKPFNRLKLILGSGVNALDNFSIYGVFLRPDYDGDGVMDCINDGLLTDLTNVTVSPENVCSGDEPQFTVAGGVENNTYTLIFNNLVYDDIEDKTTTARKIGDKLVFDDPNFLTSLHTGYYNVTVDQDNDLNGILFSIHPTETTWLGTVSEDWNNWSNWTHGVPWDCTNVILPSPTYSASSALGLDKNGSIHKYPNLIKNFSRSNIYDAPYYCHNIYFANGAELVGQHKLHYSGQVFIDKYLEPGYYHLLSTPLQAMITGDMFIAGNLSEWEQNRDDTFGNYFLPINSTSNYNYQEQRTNPYIYQRFWSSGNDQVKNETLTRSSSQDNYDNTTDEAIECDLLTTDWSRTFNSVESVYEQGQGFAIRAGDADVTGDPYHFHFPKSFDTYNYYNVEGDSPIKTITGITRQGYIGHFWIDANNNANLSEAITLTREGTGNLFLFGNPMMSHINISQFFGANPSVTEMFVYNKVEKDYETITKDGIATTQTTQIAPMEAVFIKTEHQRTSLDVTLNDDMLEEKNNGNVSPMASNLLRLTANYQGYSSSCIIVASSTANDSYDSSEDAILLVGSEEGSGVAVFTAADGKALSIQCLKSATRIPVGFYLKQTGNVSLAFDDSDNAWNGWKLKDEQTGRSYPINGRITLNDVSTGSGRFFLEKLQ